MIPAPIHLELTPIPEVLSKSAWGQTWDDYGIDARQKNLKEALNMYPAHVGANIDRGMLLTIVYAWLIIDIIILCRILNYKGLPNVNVAKWTFCLTSTSVWMSCGVPPWFHNTGYIQLVQ